jgi:hypothetical protein
MPATEVLRCATSRSRGHSSSADKSDKFGDAVDCPSEGNYANESEQNHFWFHCFLLFFEVVEELVL